jgi:uncharacterized SAM-binding protein YcdF (DUF218 family)
VLITSGVASLLLLSLPIVSDSLVRAVQTPSLARSPTGLASMIVVLGGGISPRVDAPGGYAPLPKALERLSGAARLARHTGLPLLLCGGVVEHGPAEADVLEATLEQSFGLRARYLERQSRTTVENARYTALLLRPLGVTHIALVTSALHMRRAKAEFEAVGFTVVPVPVDVMPATRFEWVSLLPTTRALDRSHDALYEWLGERVAEWSGRR